MPEWRADTSSCASPAPITLSLYDAMLAAFSESAPFDARQLLPVRFLGRRQFALRYAWSR